MSDYSHRPGGAFKFKGESDKYVAPPADFLQPDTNRKKKKKSHSSSSRAEVEATVAEKEKVRESKDKADDNEKREPGPSAGAASGGRKMTEAERRFEETQRKRVGLSGA